MADPVSPLESLAPPESQDTGMSWPTQAETANEGAPPSGDKLKYENEARQRSTAARGQLATAYGTAGDTLRQATERLKEMQFGPTQQELLYREAAARLGHGQNAVGAMGNVADVRAQGLGEQRQGELERQKLMTQYPMLAAQYGISQAQQAQTAARGDFTAEARAAAPQIRKEAQLANTALRLGWRYSDPNDPTSPIVEISGSYAEHQRMAAAHQYGVAAGQLQAVPQSDGTVKYVPKSTYLPGAQQPPAAAAPPAQTTTPGAQPVPAPAAAPGAGVNAAPLKAAVAHAQQQQAVAAQANAAQAAAGNTATQQSEQAAKTDYTLEQGQKSPYWGMFTKYEGPGGVPLNSRIMTTNGQLAMTHAADEAFQNIPQIAYAPGKGAGPPMGEKTKIEGQQKDFNKDYEALAEKVRASSIENQQYSDMLRELPNVATGPISEQMLHLTRVLGQVAHMSQPEIDSLFKKVSGMSDADPSKQLEFQKAARTAVSTGLKAIFGGRIAVAEMQAWAKAMPNDSLTPEAIRAIISSRLEMNAELTNKLAAMGKYGSAPGSAPLQFEAWYRQYLDPFSASRAKMYMDDKKSRSFTPHYGDSHPFKDGVVRTYVGGEPSQPSSWAKAGT
jgi:hypothetical protein